MATVVKERPNIILHTVVAQGGHSAIYMGREQKSMEAVAVKEIDLKKEDVALFENEVRALRALPEHRNLPKMVGSTRAKEKARIVLSYFPFPTLREFLAEVGPLPSEDALYVFHQLIDAISALKKAGVVHRDIKSDNILINPTTLQIKLVDFGLALVKKYITEDDVDTVYVGTPIYMPPDMLKRQGSYRIIASDLWSSALVLLEMLQGSHPYRHCANEADLLVAQACPRDLSRYEIPCQVVLQGCLHPNDAYRSKIADLLKFLRTASPIDRPSPRRARWAKPLSKSLTDAPQ